MKERIGQTLALLGAALVGLGTVPGSTRAAGDENGPLAEPKRNRATLECRASASGGPVMSAFSFSLPGPVTASRQADLCFYFDGNDCAGGAIVGHRDEKGWLFPLGKHDWRDLERGDVLRGSGDSVPAIAPVTKAQEGFAIRVKTVSGREAIVRIVEVRPAIYDEVSRGKTARIEFEWMWERAGRTATTAPINIVFILADDLGWSGLGSYGSDLHETPRLDRLAQQGVRFTQAYAMSVCSPTRAAVLTGKHAARLHFTIWREGSVERLQRVGESGWPLVPPATITDLPHAETTIAERLKTAGYVTFHVGKWHLGDASHYPETQGFDVNIGGTQWGAPESYFWPFRGTNRFRENRYVPVGLGKPGDYLTDRLTDEALRLIDLAGDRAFFLNLWFHNPHTPIEAKPEVSARFREKITPDLRHRNPDYAAMLASLDENVGRVLDRLEARGLAERTLVVFTSDNGGYLGEFQGQRVTDNGPLRSGKGSLYEGGIRVPLIARLPGATPRGAVCAEPVTCMDLARTFAEVAGVSFDTALDGVSLAPLLRDPRGTLGREAIYFHYPHYYATTTPVSAARFGSWKLLEYFEDGRLELYNLRDDPGETTNLAPGLPDRARALRARLEAWREEVGAQRPTANLTGPGRRQPVATPQRP